MDLKPSGLLPRNQTLAKNQMIPLNWPSKSKEMREQKVRIRTSRRMELEERFLRGRQVIERLTTMRVMRGINNGYRRVVY